MAQGEFIQRASEGVGSNLLSNNEISYAGDGLSQYRLQRSDTVAAFLTGRGDNTASPYDDIPSDQSDVKTIEQAWMRNSFMNDGMPVSNYYGKAQGRSKADKLPKLKDESILDKAPQSLRLFKI